MKSNFQKCRDEVIQILAQNDTYHMTQKDLDILNEKYGQLLIITVLDYLQQHGTICPRDYKILVLPDPQIILKRISLTAKGIDEVNQYDFGKIFNIRDLKKYAKSGLIKLRKIVASHLANKLIEQLFKIVIIVFTMAFSYLKAHY